MSSEEEEKGKSHQHQEEKLLSSLHIAVFLQSLY
jgi:hypothetical protein